MLTGVVASFLAKGMEARARRRRRQRPRTSAPPRSPRSRPGWLHPTSWAGFRRRSIHRSAITIDLGAVRRNTRTLLRALDGSDLWAVVKANGYGHGAVDVAAAALGSGASAICVVTVAEGLELRREFPAEKIVVLGPAEGRDVAFARDAGLELVVSTDEIPEGVRVHLKLDTGMGRFGLPELPSPPVEVVGLTTPPRDGRQRPRLRS